MKKIVRATLALCLLNNVLCAYPKYEPVATLDTLMDASVIAPVSNADACPVVTYNSQGVFEERYERRIDADGKVVPEQSKVRIFSALDSVNNDRFVQQALNNSLPVVVFIYSSSGKECAKLRYERQKLADFLEGKVLVFSLDIVENPGFFDSLKAKLGQAKSPDDQLMPSMLTCSEGSVGAPLLLLPTSRDMLIQTINRRLVGHRKSRQARMVAHTTSKKGGAGLVKKRVKRTAPSA